MFKKVLQEYLVNNKLVLLGLFLLLALEIGLTALIPTWRSYFYGLVEAKHITLVATGCWLFVGLISGLVIVQSLKTWLRAIIGLNLRAIITDILLTKWSSVPCTARKTLNFPDQRINEDAKICTIQSVNICTECIISGFIVISLIFTVSHSLLLWALLYTSLVLGLSVIFHNPMVKADINLQVAEAAQRFELTQMVIDNEYDKTKNWYDSLQHKYTAIAKQYRHYMALLLGYNCFNGIQNGLTMLIPFIILVPLYFNNTINFGDVMGGVAAFELIVINATILLNLYPQLISMSASWKRVTDFYNT